MLKRTILLDRALLASFRAIAAPYWFSEEKMRAWALLALLALLVLLLLGQALFAVMLNGQTGEFTSALAAKDGARFWASIERCFGVLLLGVPVYAFYYYVRDTLGLRWRRWLTRAYLASYLGNGVYFRLDASSGIDNPDQRIAEDINTFTQKSLQFLLVLAGAVLQLAAFAGVLWSISRGLVLFLVIYAFIGTFITVVLFGQVLIGLNFYQLKREADFRFSLVRIRENAEAIAFYAGEKLEAQQVERNFGEVFSNFSRLIRVQLNLNIFQYAYSFMTIILPSAIIADRVISGELEVGRAIQAAGAFAAILAALTVIVDNFESFSKFAAGIERLDSFAGVMDGRAEVPMEKGIAIVEDSRVVIDRLTLWTPNRERQLIVDLSLSVEPGGSLMIVGSSGCGKSSLLRAIAGLWRAGAGRIARPAAGDMLFLPQRPYMLLGSLRNQLLYPRQDRPVSDEELLDVLAQANLPDLAARVGGLDGELDWTKVLSMGEQQRVAFARVLLLAPRYVILDEATSALDATNEEHLYRLLAASGIAFVSVAHRASIRPYHRQILEFGEAGRWVLQGARYSKSVHPLA